LRIEQLGLTKDSCTSSHKWEHTIRSQDDRTGRRLSKLRTATAHLHGNTNPTPPTKPKTAHGDPLLLQSPDQIQKKIESPKQKKLAPIDPYDTDWGQEFAVNRELRNADPDDYDALLLPGGQMNPDSLRMDQQAVAFVTFVVASSGNTFSKVELEDLQQNGAVGDICFCFYDANGREGKGALEGRVIGDRYAGRCRCEASRLHRR
jgi:hypothetical protein